MEIKNVKDASFEVYGRVIDIDASDIVEGLKKTNCPEDATVYVASCPELEALPSFNTIQNTCFGGMPLQIGYCNGNNRALNSLEYHRDSEYNIFGTDAVLLVASLQKIKDSKLDTSEVEAFFAPKGSVVEMYATTLHYAPCCAKGEKTFLVSIILPRGTNTDKPEMENKTEEDKLLWAKNKWLITLEGTDDAKAGAFVGLTGENIILE